MNGLSFKCVKDRFQSLLRIDFLKGINTPYLAAASTSSGSSSQVTISSGTEISQVNDICN